jgi:hypothetical protein
MGMRLLSPLSFVREKILTSDQNYATNKFLAIPVIHNFKFQLITYTNY